MNKFSKYVGLDVHQETIAVAVADMGGEVRYMGEIVNTPEAIAKVVAQLKRGTGRLALCYEAGPCGYTICRQLRGLKQDCQVVAPSLIPKKPGERVKTDRRDALSLARLHRAGELSPVWIPDEAQEALRDLTRAREDMKHLQRQAKQRLPSPPMVIAIRAAPGGRNRTGAGWKASGSHGRSNRSCCRNISTRYRPAANAWPDSTAKSRRRRTPARSGR